MCLGSGCPCNALHSSYTDSLRKNDKDNYWEADDQVLSASSGDVWSSIICACEQHNLHWDEMAGETGDTYLGLSGKFCWQCTWCSRLVHRCNQCSRHQILQWSSSTVVGWDAVSPVHKERATENISWSAVDAHLFRDIAYADNMSQQGNIVLKRRFVISTGWFNLVMSHVHLAVNVLWCVNVRKE